ncbi:molybdenum ABC transporter ATP-binding protein [Pseudomonas sp. MLB6B]
MNSGIHVRQRLERGDFALDVDLHLPGRGVSALFGHSGSGKTSCLRCLAGLEPTSEGLVEVNGDVWQDSARHLFVPPHKRPIGYVFQEASLFAHLTVRDNLEFGWRRVVPGQRRVGLEQACELLGIGHLLARAPATLSGGEAQRVGIARALLTSPRLLLMDEPLAALDGARKREILPYLERLHAELDIPVVYVSHSQDEVVRLADHLVLLEQGRAQASGPLSALLNRLDLPLSQAEDAGVVLQAEVVGFDERYGLLELRLPGLHDTTLRIAHTEQALGTAVRIKVQARDVSLALAADQASSILNRLPVQVRQCQAADNPAHLLVGLDAGRHALLARITRYSADHLQVAPGQQLWAQIKSVAILG